MNIYTSLFFTLYKSKKSILNSCGHEIKFFYERRKGVCYSD